VQGIELAAQLETLMHERSYVSNYLLSHDPAYLTEAAPHHAQFQAWIEQMDAFARTDGERDLVRQMRGEYLEYTASGDEVIRLEHEGKQAQARQLFFSMKRAIDGLLGDGQRLFKLSVIDMQARQVQTEGSITRERRLIFLLTALGALASLASGFLLARYAARPLYRMVLRLGASGLTDQFQFKGDELGALEAHVNALLTHVRSQERALQQAGKLSELGELAAEIAHETLNPLAGARGMLQVLARGAAPESLPDELRAIDRELRRVEEIVRRLVRYARPLEPHPRKVMLADVAEAAVRSARGAPGTQGREIRLTTAPGLEWLLDPALLEQVLVNLLVNACEASSPGGLVELHVGCAEDTLRLEVRDHGSGITLEQRERLFRPFFTTKPQGNGLGLAVSKNIVEEHGGSIEASSDPQAGTIFRVTLPRGEAPWASPS
jgi:signal transduction histidine kinase